MSKVTVPGIIAALFVGIVSTVVGSLIAYDINKAREPSASTALDQTPVGTSHEAEPVPKSPTTDASTLSSGEELTSTATGVTPVEAGWQGDTFDGHRYATFSGVSTWDGAIQYCTSQGGYLATISSHEENHFLLEWLHAQEVTSAYFGYYQDAANSWGWVEPEGSSYTNWAPGEPNDEGGRERYAMFYKKFKDGTWNDGDFRDQDVFICEFAS